MSKPDCVINMINMLLFQFLNLISLRLTQLAGKAQHQTPGTKVPPLRM